MQRVPPFDSQQLISIAKILADSLSGSEIGFLLKDSGITDPDPSNSKWKRLYNAFADFQNSNHFGNHVVLFLNKAMNPVQYTSDPKRFDDTRRELNNVLSFVGITIGSDGRARWTPKVDNLDDALHRADRLQAALRSRNVHEDVLKYCRAELLQENYFHAVFEATKSIAAKIREMTGLTSDGAELAQTAFTLPKDGTPPMLAINQLASDTDKGEQRGFVNLLIGLFGTIRNPAAHNPKLEWPIDEQDALDILTLTSLVHRKLDRSRKPASASP